MSNTNKFSTFNRLRSEQDQREESYTRDTRHISAHRNGIDVDIIIGYTEHLSNAQAEDIIRYITKL